MCAARVKPMTTREVIDAVDVGWHAGLGPITTASCRGYVPFLVRYARAHVTHGACNWRTKRGELMEPFRPAHDQE
jgi:hypothetical protein